MRPRSFEDKLRARTDDFSLVPKPGTWENIESQLPPGKSKRKGAFWLAGALVLLVAAGIGINQYPGKEGRQQQPVAFNNAKSEALPISPKAAAVEDAISHTAKVNESHPSHENTSGVLSPAYLKPNTRAGKTPAYSGFNSYANQPESIVMEDILTSEPRSVSAGINNADQGSAPLFENTGVNDSASLQPENTVSDVAGNAPAIKKPAQKDTAQEKKEIFNLRDYLAKRVSRQVIFSELVFQPLLSGSFINIDKNYKDQDTYKDQQADRKQNDKRVWTYGIGLQAGLEKKRWLVTAGVFYQKLSYQMAVQNINSGIISGSIVNKSFDYNATDSFAVSNFSNPNRIAGAPRVIEGGRDYVTNTFEYLSIPLSITYKLKYKGRFNIGLSGSIMPQFLLSYQGLLYQNESNLYVKQKSAQENHIMPRNLALAGGLELSYHLSRHSNLFARPQYGFSLYPAEEATVHTYTRFRSFSIGYRYYF